MLANPLRYIEQLEPVGFTHIFLPCAFYNNFYENNLPEWLKVNAQKLQIIIGDRGGVMGFAGNHDMGTLNAVCSLEAGVFGNKRFSFLKRLDQN